MKSVLVPFTQTAEYSTDSTFGGESLKELPSAILKHTQWEYLYQKTENGCFLKPTFRNMPGRNSFVPEIDITLSSREEKTVLSISGKPIKVVGKFMAFYFPLF